MIATIPVTCPTCFEVFEAPAPPVTEAPCEVDYDCEVCCRPMVIVFETEPASNEVHGHARGLDE